MKIFITSWIIAFVSIIVIDAVWLSLMGARFYKIYLSGIFADEFDYKIAIIFYLLYSFGISYLLIVPNLGSSIGSYKIIINGFILGLISYAAYDLTNQATIKNWPLIVSVVDMAWGAALTSMVTFITYKFIKL